VYEKASLKKTWWLVRHAAGMLEMKSDEIAKVIKSFSINNLKSNYIQFNLNLLGCFNFNC
jgi:hypothetical protein